MSRLPALRDLRADLADRRLSAIEYVPPAYPPAVAPPPAPPARVDYAAVARRSTLTTNDLLDRLAPEYRHSTTLGGFDPNVVEWLDQNRVPISPAGTVMLLKGVKMDYRSYHGTLYLPGHRVVDPDWGKVEGAGIYLCGTRENVEYFMNGWGSYRLLLVEVAVSALGLYQINRRKIVAREVYVHREVRH